MKSPTLLTLLAFIYSVNFFLASVVVAKAFISSNNSALSTLLSSSTLSCMNSLAFSSSFILSFLLKDF